MMIGAAHGMDTSDYTIPYVATWAQSVADKEPVDVRIPFSVGAGAVKPGRVPIADARIRQLVEDFQCHATHPLAGLAHHVGGRGARDRRAGASRGTGNPRQAAGCGHRRWVPAHGDVDRRRRAHRSRRTQLHRPGPRRIPFSVGAGAVKPGRVPIADARIRQLDSLRRDVGAVGGGQGTGGRGARDRRAGASRGTGNPRQAAGCGHPSDAAAYPSQRRHGDVDRRRRAHRSRRTQLHRSSARCCWESARSGYRSPRSRTSRPARAPRWGSRGYTHPTLRHTRHSAGTETSTVAVVRTGVAVPNSTVRARDVSRSA
jgi:hypothetical protein